MLQNMYKRMHLLPIVASLTVLLALSCSRHDSYTINGQCSIPTANGSSVMLTLYLPDGTTRTDSTTIAPDGTFAFLGVVEEPGLAQISTNMMSDSIKDAHYSFFIENSNIKANIRQADKFGIKYAKTSIAGSRVNAKYLRALGRYIIDDMIIETYPDDVQRFLDANPNSIFGPYAYYTTLLDGDSFADFQARMEAFGPAAQHTYHYQLMLKRYAQKSNLSAGQPMADFTLPDTAGRLINLHQFLEGKRYVVVDFWASWCGPCRVEGKRLRQLYQHHRDEGFDVLGVSIDTDRSPWLEAIKYDSLPWLNVCELSNADSAVATRLFGIRSVPNVVLIDSTGLVIATHLHGQLLDEAVEQALAR